MGFVKYPAGEGAELVRMRLHMTNVGDEEVEVPHTGSGIDAQLTFELVDDQGRRYEVKHSRVSDSPIGPGLTERALFAFEVPKDQDSRYLVVQSEVVLIK